MAAMASYSAGGHPSRTARLVLDDGMIFPAEIVIDQNRSPAPPDPVTLRIDPKSIRECDIAVVRGAAGRPV